MGTVMKVISYNLRKHRAAGELATLVAEHDPDILCLQECDVPALPDRIGGLVLADATHQAGPPALQEGALLNIETFFGWVSDVAAFEAALHSDEARRIPV